MSRGGRGGSYSGPPGARLNHGTVPFEISQELLQRSEGIQKDVGLFPHMDVPRPKPVNKRELEEVDAYVELRTKRQLGPYYMPSTAAERAAMNKKGRAVKENDKSTFNAFADQSTWFSKQDESRRRFKEEQFKQLHWRKELLPKELWGVTGLAEGAQYWPKGTLKSQSRLSMKQKLDRVDDVDVPDANDKELDNASDKDPDEDEEAADEDADNDYEDDEDDMAEDYNAEQYFDGGEDDDDDIGGIDGAGGGGGGED